jgi:NADH dehydrogenase
MAGVHVQGVRNALGAAAHAGASRFVHISAVGADTHSPTAYLRTKGDAERCVAAAGLPYTIIRPTVVFGPGGPGRNLVAELGGILRVTPFMPVFGDGRYPMQPVSARNVAAGCARALTLPAAAGRTYEAGGPERLTYDEVLRRIAAAMGRPFRPLHVPLGLIRPLLPALQHLPGFPLTVDQLTMLLDGSVCDPGPFFEAFGLTPDPFDGR